MGAYDHRRHAGNAGDVWKHFLLCEAAGFLMDPGSGSAAAPCLVYLESHAGRPDYSLRAPGEWQGGIGRILPLISLHSGLRDFSYFDILADLNSGGSKDGIIYPGSGRLIYELAKKKKARLSAHLWDNDHDVAESWNCFMWQANPRRPSPPIEIVFQEDDGFSGVLPKLQSSPPGLLFIDPPYIDTDDELQAKALLQTAVLGGWTVLWWYMSDLKTLPQRADREDLGDLAHLELRFVEAGLDGGRWVGSTVALAGGQRQQLPRLLQHLGRQKERLIRMLKSV